MPARCLMLAALATSVALGAEEGGEGPRVVQYFAQWSIYGRDYSPWKMKLDEITHVNYAFWDVTAACRVASLDPYADFFATEEFTGYPSGNSETPFMKGNVGAFQAIKDQYPHLKIALSLGGWSLSGHFSECVSSSSKRAVLVNSALALLRVTGFDAIDVDWEYPVCCGLDANGYNPNDWDNYLLLLHELRHALDEEYPSVHKELTIAMGMNPDVTDRAPKKELADVLDCINLMTYDYNGAWSMLTAFNAPLYHDPAYEDAGGNPHFHAEWGVLQWADAVPLSKLVMGMPAYGRSWYGTMELYDQATGPGPGTYWEPPAGGEELGILRYDEITSARFAGFTRIWNENSQVPYMVGITEGKQAFITYDDPESIAIKAEFAKATGLAGMMWWEASEDPDAVLLLAANQAWNAAPTANASNPAGRRLKGADAARTPTPKLLFSASI